MIVRLEEPRDREAALAVERSAFESAEEAEIVRAVRDEPGSFALVAAEEGVVVGHVQMSRAWIGGTDVVALGPIGVQPERQRMGIGSALIRAALEEARRLGCPAVILLGNPDLYHRFGFEPASAYGLRNPFAGVMPDGFVIREEDFMLAPLDERVGSLRGPVRWHEVFGQPSSPIG